MPNPAPQSRLLRARPDLEVVEQDAKHGDRYTVKDTVSLEYFLLRRREYFLLRELGTPQTVEQLHAAYRRRHPADDLSLEEVRRFCVMLHDCSLISAEGVGQGPLLAERAAKKRPKRWLWLLSPLAIRLPGFDPTPLLSVLRWWGATAFSRTFAVLLAAAMLLVGGCLVSSVEQLADDLAGLAHLSDPRYVVAAMLALVLVKSWHELGHALACQRFGGECHEIGVMLLALMPCLYCDVSDAWAFRRRRQRAVVALGGVFFELMLATAALAAWVILAPGMPRVFVLYVAVIASVSTVLVNLNPLMRFDGYYLLSDVWGVANLQQQSRQALWAPLERWISGRNAPEQPLDAPRALLIVYAIASVGQMVMVIAMILWFSHRTLSEMGFRFAADTLVAITLGGVLLRCLLSLTRPLRGRRFEKHWAPALRMALVLLVAGGGLWALASAPIEQTLWSPCRIESDQVAPIAAQTTGELVRTVAYDQRVAPGDAIAELTDASHKLQKIDVQQEIARVESGLAGLRTLVQSDPTLFSDISLHETELNELRRKLRTLEAEERRLVLRAPIAGLATRPPPRAWRDDDNLQTWSGGALDPENAGCSVEPGDLLCILTGGELHAVIMLKESDSGLTAVGDRVRIALDRAPGQRVLGTVEEIALVTADDDRSRPTDTADVALEQSLNRPLESDNAYRVRVRLDATPGFAQHGSVGQARIITGHETIAGWAARWLRRIVRFQ